MTSNINYFFKKFVANYDMKTCKKCKHNEIVHCISFNLHNLDPENHYKELLNSHLNMSME